MASESFDTSNNSPVSLNGERHRSHHRIEARPGQHRCFSGGFPSGQLTATKPVIADRLFFSSLYINKLSRDVSRFSPQTAATSTIRGLLRVSSQPRVFRRAVRVNLQTLHRNLIRRFAQQGFNPLHFRHISASEYHKHSARFHSDNRNLQMFPAAVPYPSVMFQW